MRKTVYHTVRAKAREKRTLPELLGFFLTSLTYGIRCKCTQRESCFRCGCFFIVTPSVGGEVLMRRCMPVSYKHLTLQTMCQV